MADRILILGASARAAAASARRAGLEPFAVDLFADADTRRLCDVLRCPPDDYPDGLFRLAPQAPPMPWMYTGGLENYPELVGALAAERELWGNGPDVLRVVRDPVRFSTLMCEQGIAHPRLLAPDSRLPPNTNWIRKPRRGSAGFGIRPATGTDPATPDYFIQEYVPGRPMSAAFTVNGSHAQLMGVTTQLVGSPWLHAPNFRYAGNCWARPPVEIDIGDVLDAAKLLVQVGVRGVFGIDFIHDGNRAHVIEVNPRYVASIEVIEFVTQQTMRGRSWCWDDQFNRRPDRRVDAPRIAGKAIYYAARRLTVPASGPWDDSLAHAADVWRRPDYADIPHPGDVVEPGQPVLTLLAEADTEPACVARLQSMAADLDHLFGVPTPCPP